MDDESDGKEREESCVSAERGSVLVDAVVDETVIGTCAEGAIGIGSVGHEAPEGWTCGWHVHGHG